eukprot:8770704-Pyramimonas_sp.AAC.1
MISFHIGAICSYELGAADLLVGSPASASTHKGPDQSADANTERIAQLESQLLKVWPPGPRVSPV